jgi:hypothetical protein
MTLKKLELIEVGRLAEKNCPCITTVSKNMLVVGVARPFCVKTKLAFILTAIIKEIIMAKQMRICDQDLIINKVVKSVEQVRREAYEKDIKSQPEWKKFVSETTKYQKEYDRIEKLKSELNSARDSLEERIKDFNVQNGFTGYNEGICHANYHRDRPSIHINTNGLDYEVRQAITEEVRFSGMSGDFDARQMVEDLVAKFS